MRRNPRTPILATLALLAAAFTLHPAQAQTSGGMNAPLGSTSPTQVQVITPPIDAQALRERRRKHEQKLTADTDKLVTLATQLKTEMAHPTTGTPPVEALNIATQIQKLAHSIQKQLQSQP
jgi:hypothetical protein